MFEIEFELRTEDQIIVSHSNRFSNVTICADYRDVLDQISNEKIASWKGLEILESFSEQEIRQFLDYNYGD